MMNEFSNFGTLESLIEMMFGPVEGGVVSEQF